MTRSTIWRVLVVLFILVNLFGAGYAAIAGEGMHFAIHACLLLLTALVIWIRSSRRAERY
jgi:hypothetical protein